MEIPAGDVVDRERAFFNAQGQRYLRVRAWIWRAIGEFNRNSELADLYDPHGKRVLLYGCGPAHETGRFIQSGAAHVSGIDISDSEIAQAWRTARESGYEDRVDFRAGDAHATEFPDDSFDLIVGSAILHHLDVPRALAELSRILAPGGRAVFLEPLAHNPLLRLGRRFTPSARTVDEHPFTVKDWQLCAEAFPEFWHREVELISIPLMPLNLVLPRSWQRVLARGVRGLDDRLLARYPQLGRFARSTFLILE
jgi:ubiquinone/menaquinone biosynthesis C-methylase UbiE